MKNIFRRFILLAAIFAVTQTNTAEESKTASSTNNQEVTFFVKTFTDGTLTIPIAQSRPMSELYDKVRSKLDLNDADTLRIILGGKVLENNDTLISFYNLTKESTVHAVIRTASKVKEVEIDYGDLSFNVSYTQGITTNHDIYVQTAELINNDKYVLEYINRSTKIDSIYGLASILPDNDDIFITISDQKGPYSFYAKTRKNVDHEHTSATVSAGPMDSIGVGAGAASAAEPLDPEVVVVSGPELVVTHYLAPSPATVAELEGDAAILLGLQTLGATLDPKNYNDDIQRTHRDFNNLVFVEYLLKNLFKIKYNELIKLDLDEKATILKTLLTYYRTNEADAIRVLLMARSLI